MTDKAKAALWLFLVYAFSVLCYLPRLLEMGGAAVPKALTGLSGGFILAPAFVTLGFLLPARRVRAHFLENGRAVSLKVAAVCFSVALLGALASLLYSFAAGVNLFSQTYGSAAGFGGSCLYLYATAFAEEFSWRAFFLKALAAKGRKVWALLPAGFAWAFWHIPMWTAHGLPALEQVQLFIWAVLVSLVLGGLCLRGAGLFALALCHMLFNVCFLAPAWCNVLALLCPLAVYTVWRRKKSHRFL